MNDVQKLRGQTESRFLSFFFLFCSPCPQGQTPPGINNPLLVSHLNHSTAELEDSDLMGLNLLSQEKLQLREGRGLVTQRTGVRTGLDHALDYTVDHLLLSCPTAEHPCTLNHLELLRG